MTDFGTIGTAALICGGMMVLDVVAGLLAAASNGTIDSTTLRKGLMHKLGLCLALVLAAALEYACTVLPLGISLPIFIPVACYIILMEACSTYENIKKVNPDFRPTNFEDLFSFSKDDGGSLPAETTQTAVPEMDADALRAAERYMRRFIEEQETDHE